MPKKNFDTPDETKTLSKSKVDTINIADRTLFRIAFEPGWRWSENLKPTVGTDSCQVHHIMYVLSGQMKVVMDDGTDMEIADGDVADIPPGHDAWVIGDEPCVCIDISGSNYAMPAVNN